MGRYEPRVHGTIALLTAAEPNSLWLSHTRLAALGMLEFWAAGVLRSEPSFWATQPPLLRLVTHSINRLL